MQALPMMTPSMVSIARTLLARNACMARLQVSAHSKGALFETPWCSVTGWLDAGGAFEDTGSGLTGLMRGLVELVETVLGLFVLGIELQRGAVLLTGFGALALGFVEASQPSTGGGVGRPVAAIGSAGQIGFQFLF